MLFSAQLLQIGKSEVLQIGDAAFKRHDIVGANQVAEVVQGGGAIGIFDTDIDGFRAFRIQRIRTESTGIHVDSHDLQIFTYGQNFGIDDAGERRKDRFSGDGCESLKDFVQICDADRRSVIVKADVEISPDGIGKSDQRLADCVVVPDGCEFDSEGFGFW